MTVTQYIDRPAPLALPPAIDLLGNEPAGTGLHFAADQHYIRDPGNPANNKFATLGDLITAGTMTFTRSSSAWGVGRLGYLQEFASGVPRLVYAPESRLTSASNMQLRVGVKAITVSAGYTYEAGDFVALTDAGNTARWMRGRVISHVGTLLVVDVYWVAPGADGSASSWVICKALGYLAEAQATNLCLRSRDQTHTAWVKASLTAALDAVGIDGTLSACTLTSTGPCYSRQQFTVTPGAVLTWSFYAKKGTSTDPKYRIYNATAGADIVAGTNYSGQINPNSFSLISVTFTVPAGCTSIFCYVQNGNDVGTVIIDACQLEVGAYPTSYIPTTTAAVTRAADSMSVALTKLPFNPAEFTLLGVAQPSSDHQNSANVLASLNKDASNLASLRNSAAGSKQVSGFVYAGGVTQANIVSAANDGVSRFRVAFGAKTNDFELVVNGVSKGTDLSGTVPAGLTSLVIGDTGDGTFGAGVKWGAPIEAITLVPRRLSQAEMIARTTA